MAADAHLPPAKCSFSGISAVLNVPRRLTDMARCLSETLHRPPLSGLSLPNAMGSHPNSPCTLPALHWADQKSSPLPLQQRNIGETIKILHRRTGESRRCHVSKCSLVQLQRNTEHKAGDGGSHRFCVEINTLLHGIANLLKRGWLHAGKKLISAKPKALKMFQEITVFYS